MHLLYHHAIYGGAWTSRTAGRTKSSMFLCLFFTLLNGRVCAYDVGMKDLNVETLLIPLDMGRFVVVHLHSTLCLHVVYNVEVENTVKIQGFLPLKGDTINQSI